MLLMKSWFSFTGGKWRCVHIDDPKSPNICLPSLHECMMSRPSEILGGLVHAPNDEQMEDDEPPPLEDVSQVHLFDICAIASE